jgi:hypothetical protein
MRVNVTLVIAFVVGWCVTHQPSASANQCQRANVDAFGRYVFLSEALLESGEPEVGWPETLHGRLPAAGEKLGHGRYLLFDGTQHRAILAMELIR